MKEVLIFIGFIILTFATIFGLAATLAELFGPPGCAAETKDMGFNHDWSLFGNCRIEISPGRWVLLENYIVNEPKMDKK